MKNIKPDKLRAEKIKSLEKELGCRIHAIAPAQASPLAQLSPVQYNRLQFLESEIGVSLVAYEPISGLRLAKPSAQKIKRLKEVEKELGYVLVTYEVINPNQGKQELAAPQLPQAQLTEAQHARLQELEEESELVLMAYKK